VAGVAAYAGARIISAFSSLLVSPRRVGEPQLSDFPVFLLTLLQHVPAGAIFVLAGAMVAPRRRFATALLLAICWIGLSLATHILTQTYWGRANFVHLAMESAGAAIGIACVRYLVSKDQAIDAN
jgi:peptidoglycan/LPS O-acetylase OafA/YrhL